MPDTSLASGTTNTITFDDAKSQWDALLAKVGRGEEWFITDADGQPIAKLSPTAREAEPAPKRWEAFGMMKGQIEVAPDFDEPLEEMKPYME